MQLWRRKNRIMQFCVKFFTFASARIYSECSAGLSWSCLDERENPMTKRNLVEIKARRPNSRTMNWLTKAQAGEIPVSVLEKVSLDKQDVADFLSSNIPIMRSSAKGAGLGTLAMFFDELDLVLQQV